MITIKQNCDLCHKKGHDNRRIAVIIAKTKSCASIDLCDPDPGDFPEAENSTGTWYFKSLINTLRPDYSSQGMTIVIVFFFIMFFVIALPYSCAIPFMLPGETEVVCE